MAAINRDTEVTRYLNRPVEAHAVATFCDVVTEHWAPGMGSGSCGRKHRIDDGRNVPGVRRRRLPQLPGCRRRSSGAGMAGGEGSMGRVGHRARRGCA